MWPAIAAWRAAPSAAPSSASATHSSDPADFLLENLKIQTHVIETAWRSGVRRLLFLGSSCIDPKVAGIKLCEALRLQHGFDAISLMPTNLYGPGDNYHLNNSHVLPALIRRFHEAAEAKAPSVTCWGTGSPLREFLHVDDLGEACVFALEHWSQAPGELTYLNVATATGYQGTIEWNRSKPDGTPKKQLDVSSLATLGWRARIPLAEGLASTVALFREELAQQLVRL